MVNSPGTIDSDYRGEVQLIVINLGQEPVVIQRGQRSLKWSFSELFGRGGRRSSCLLGSPGGGFGHSDENKRCKFEI